MIFPILNKSTNIFTTSFVCGTKTSKSENYGELFINKNKQNNLSIKSVINNVFFNDLKGWLVSTIILFNGVASFIFILGAMLAMGLALNLLETFAISTEISSISSIIDLSVSMKDYISIITSKEMDLKVITLNNENIDALSFNKIIIEYYRALAMDSSMDSNNNPQYLGKIFNQMHWHDIKDKNAPLVDYSILDDSIKANLKDLSSLDCINYKALNYNLLFKILTWASEKNPFNIVINDIEELKIENVFNAQLVTMEEIIKKNINITSDASSKYEFKNGLYDRNNNISLIDNFIEKLINAVEANTNNKLSSTSQTILLNIFKKNKNKINLTNIMKKYYELIDNMLNSQEITKSANSISNYSPSLRDPFVKKIKENVEYANKNSNPQSLMNIIYNNGSVLPSFGAEEDMEFNKVFMQKGIDQLKFSLEEIYNNIFKNIENKPTFANWIKENNDDRNNILSTISDQSLLNFKKEHFSGIDYVIKKKIAQYYSMCDLYNLINNYHDTINDIKKELKNNLEAATQLITLEILDDKDILNFQSLKKSLSPVKKTDNSSTQQNNVKLDAAFFKSLSEGKLLSDIIEKIEKEKNDEIATKRKDNSDFTNTINQKNQEIKSIEDTINNSKRSSGTPVNESNLREQIQNINVEINEIKGNIDENNKDIVKLQNTLKALAPLKSISIDKSSIYNKTLETLKEAIKNEELLSSREQLVQYYNLVFSLEELSNFGLNGKLSNLNISAPEKTILSYVEIFEIAKYDNTTGKVSFDTSKSGKSTGVYDAIKSTNTMIKIFYKMKDFIVNTFNNINNNNNESPEYIPEYYQLNNLKFNQEYGVEDEGFIAKYARNSAFFTIIYNCIIPGLMIVSLLLLESLTPSLATLTKNKINTFGYVELMNSLSNINKTYYNAIGANTLIIMSNEYLKNLDVIHNYICKFIGKILILTILPILISFIMYLLVPNSGLHDRYFNTVNLDDDNTIQKSPFNISQLFKIPSLWINVLFQLMLLNLIVIYKYKTYVLPKEFPVDFLVAKKQASDAQDFTPLQNDQISVGDIANTNSTPFIIQIFSILFYYSCMLNVALLSSISLKFPDKNNTSSKKFFIYDYNINDTLEQLSIMWQTILLNNPDTTQSNVFMLDSRVKFRTFGIMILMVMTFVMMRYIKGKSDENPEKSNDFIISFSAQTDKFITILYYMLYIEKKFQNIIFDKENPDNFRLNGSDLIGFHIKFERFSYPTITETPKGTYIGEGPTIIKETEMEIINEKINIIVGETGSGKTTILNILKNSDLSKIKSSKAPTPEVQFIIKDQFGRIRSMNQNTLSEYDLNKKIFYIPQQVKLPQYLTVRDVFQIFYDSVREDRIEQQNYEYYYLIKNINSEGVINKINSKPSNYQSNIIKDETIRSISEICGLYPEIKDTSRPVGLLSGGQQQRLYIGTIYLRLLSVCSENTIDANGYVNSGVSWIFADELYIGLNYSNRVKLYQTYINDMDLMIYTNRKNNIMSLNNEIYILNNLDGENSFNIDTMEQDELDNDLQFNYQEMSKLATFIVTHLPQELTDRKIDLLWIMDKANKRFNLYNNFSEWYANGVALKKAH